MEPGGGTYSAIVLDRLARHACSVLGVEQAWILVRDRSDPRSAIAAAGYGIDIEVIGSRFAIDSCHAGKAMTLGRHVIGDYSALPADFRRPAVSGTCATGAVPIRVEDAVRGALVAATTDPQRDFEEDDLSLMAELSDLAGAALRQTENHQLIDRTVEARVETLAAAMDMRDGYTARHSDEVVGLVREVAARLGMEPAAIVELEYAARLHDVGKLAVPDAVLRKPASLDEEEWEVMRCHPIWGSEMLSAIPGLSVVATIVRFHHERWDGTGYPDRLAGNRIPLASRIIFACDAYRAMMADRPYRKALGFARAREELLDGAGSQFDAAVVDALLEVVAETESADSF
jgi:HD-GYP domain-containing protein (c-di-GMP phosphodiesterase class II)